MDQSAQQFPQQWTPEPEPVDAPQQPVAPPNYQAPHYGAPAQYAPPPQQQYVQPQQYAQPQYPQQPYPPQQYAQPQYPQQQYAAPPMPQQPYPPQQQYVQPQYPQQPYPPQAPVPQQYVPPQQYPPQQPYQQPQPQQAYVPPFGQSMPAPAPQLPQQQPPQPPQQQPAPQIPQQFSPSSSQSLPQQPQPQPQLPPMDQSGGAPVSFPPPPNLPKVRDAFLNGAAPFLQPGEQVFYGFMLKLDSTIEETPHELKIAIEGQHHVLGDINRASGKMNRGLRWAMAPGEALSEKLAEKATDAMFKALAGPVFAGGWLSQAGWFVRYVRATSEDYGPGAYGAVTNQRYLVFRGARLGGAAMRLVYAVPRTAIAGVRLEGGKDALKHGRSPRAELHFTDGSMVATTMPGKQGEQLAAVLQPPRY